MVKKLNVFGVMRVVVKSKKELKRTKTQTQTKKNKFLKEMSSVTFTIGDWQKVCSAFDLDMASVMSVLNGGSVNTAARAMVSREAVVVPSVAVVSDSESDTAPLDNFATSKTRAFAALHNIACGTLTGTGKKGKVTMEDVKKAMPPKKRGRKPKPKAKEALDVVDSLPAEAEPKAKKAKKVKDPNAPKKASNAWILYLNAHRDEFRGKHPGMKMPELTKLISVPYKALTAEEKAPWDAKVAADKERYAKELALYKATLPVVEENVEEAVQAPKAKKAKKAKKVKDPNAPKKASNAWILYLNAHRDEVRGKNPDMKMPELTKLISVSYHALTAEEKAPWDDKVTADKERYAQELALYKASKPAVEVAEVAEAKKVTKAKKVKKVKKVTKAKKVTKVAQVELEVAEAPKVSFDDAVEVDFDSDSDDELEQDAVEFEFQGETYWKTWDGFILDEEDGPQVGRWDDESESIVYFD